MRTPVFTERGKSGDERLRLLEVAAVFIYLYIWDSLERSAALAKDYEWLPETVAGLHFVAFACLFLQCVVLSSGLAPRQSCSTSPLMQIYCRE